MMEPERTPAYQNHEQLNLHRYTQLKFRVLENILKEESTNALSKELGYAFDQVRRWKIGQKELRWDEFIRLCRCLQLPIDDVLKQLLLVTENNIEPSYYIHRLRGLRPQMGIREYAKHLSCSPAVVHRYFKGEVSPPLEFVLALIDLNKNILGAFLLNLVGTNLISDLQTEFFKDRRQQDFETAWPLACAIEGLISTEEYSKLSYHDPHWFCKKLRISTELYSLCWNHILATKNVVSCGEKFKLNYSTVNTQGITPAQVCKMAGYWTKRAQYRFLDAEKGPVNKTAGPNLVCYRVVPMSKPLAKRATDILIRAHQEILELAENDEFPITEVRVFLSHHFSVEDVPDCVEPEHPQDLDV